ncbi:unnamed protein product [Gongylonema pulchrum]|uniref:Zinc metalloproteinase n=1 Tax=Gongylonema pulchrum TaxID=637853 RepID=A0A183DWA4_9BILA|nr:unnamed protein product [Gongylonema pulchrum]
MILVNETAISAGIKHWEESTCIIFQRVSPELKITPLIEFIKGDGCYSNVGAYRHGRQYVSIDEGCNTLGTVAHEIGHVLGLFHEQARFDRDNYVQVVHTNIAYEYAGQFVKQSLDTINPFGVDYDLGSAMHYDQFAFSGNGLPTLRTLDHNYQLTIGQRKQLSFNDIKKINFAYCNRTCILQLPCQRGGYTDPKLCSRCRCPEPFSGIFCELPRPGSSLCGTLEHHANEAIQTLTMAGVGECNYVIKIFMLQAKPSKRIYLLFDAFKFDSSVLCGDSFTEVRYKDVSNTGARFCNVKPEPLVSETNEAIVMYHGDALSYFVIRFRALEQSETDSKTAVKSISVLNFIPYDVDLGIPATKLVPT